METELGMRNHDNNRCKRCVAEDYECWQYTSRALRQIRKPGSACARCRAMSKTGCCDKRTRRKRTPKPGLLPPPGPR
jgi:hypothetical protein